ncbi:MAG: glycogen/starch/alpha-glucan phosphorylase [Candidatus Omnitrophota bacterium]
MRIKKTRKDIQKKAGKDKENVIEEIKSDFFYNRKYCLAKDIYSATAYDSYTALAMTVRKRLIEKWILTQQRYHDENCKRVYYFSLEFLPGCFLEQNIINLDIADECKKAMEDLGLNLQDIYQEEADPGLGNGGLGRLAACFQDSMATLGIPATGYGIRYDYGIFKQKIKNGYQIELPDEWLKLGNPWEFERPEYTIKVKFYGKTIQNIDRNGKFNVDWVDTRNMLAIAFDVPIPGYKNEIVNNLRLWSARSTDEFDFEYFNDGDYIRACESKINSENVSRVLYPRDDLYIGLELRLKQEYFFTSASIQDIMRRFKMHNSNFKVFPDKVAIQLNDTHPVIAIIELMRILIDEENLGWDFAWEITTKTFAYTNHTIMPEALETWSVLLFGRLLPRHLEIVYEINMRFLREIASHYPHDPARLRRMSIIEEGIDRKIRMSYLAIVGSHSVNGVSELHAELLKTTIFRDFFEFFPDKFNTKTNGITQRRWLRKSNGLLSEFITQTIGDEWVRDLSRVKKLETFVSDSAFRLKWESIKKQNKITLSEFIKSRTGIKVDPESMFDVQVKRIHEYKRQVLFAMYLIAEYLKIKNNMVTNIVPRTAIFAGKAAPGYAMAKLTIKLINNIAKVINNDPDVKEKLKIVFLEDYCVSIAEKIFPASNLSEQISTAGKEASGTGNMKFMLNGAVTIGTWDGANIEIAKAVGEENIFIFGLKSEEIARLKSERYVPREYLNKNPLLKEVVNLLQEDFFSQFEPGIFKAICESLIGHDPYMVFADFGNYIDAQEKVSQAYKNSAGWTKKSIMNTANSGKFSSDRTVAEYANEIWGINV